MLKLNDQKKSLLKLYQLENIYSNLRLAYRMWGKSLTPTKYKKSLSGRFYVGWLNEKLGKLFLEYLVNKLN
ncbi:hypothetical protein A2303_03130 [Candidatus Falkowbacteria bacterium RIFOXYB2_FULL_47_14]|uniref:Uncharacterized protein n=1 Tax=Candidatus Falkowbacteria bacterium RIFOXYA2_FULL_47_19 TaxID=1797994 RepID=A0A1F5SG74_9BACT|nr:MAG: hypothetical protein A2227_07845 [Candidatus Falkowbacteria bacterium RIFOXYA2_FULL_47_19]OGF35182.1 MAG: hypothetical protein A2468_01965 [Candidatus Falkowbacteria bacterium RIFOXYC2_FULL_46_15]OGF43347.1 MAG: hypothetical protein A2303_03130 [Candidatus Falkowbacteria bacterium RIFOXYB2_FULL_47_14]